MCTRQTSVFPFAVVSVHHDVLVECLILLATDTDFVHLASLPECRLLVAEHGTAAFPADCGPVSSLGVCLP